MRILVTMTAAGVLLTALPGLARAQAPRGQERLRDQIETRQRFDRRRDGNLTVGDLAPDFTVQDVQGTTTVKLSELRGKPVVLIFGSCT